MEAEFKHVSSYSLRKWLPALFGYVKKDHETTSKFLTDWRKTLSDLVSKYVGVINHEERFSVRIVSSLPSTSFK